ncbi:alpha/beta fold hydrolase [Streptomyces gobiensis]|uniref:alpha/beta fold hydrolase n=1 Tax=Streptomyces gobiensis TaxID=2875706 RepID=UPI001E4D4A22|nr:alpha/beta hydrolase [Streptomyces gobiensis]UGY94141.1 alpha/beta hydrolase [Streptomyces gobiensis]
MASETRTLELSGTPVHYWLAGPPSGPLVVCLHGASMDHHMFDEQVPALAQEGYQVLTVDLRGHGQSKPIGRRRDYNMPALAQELLTLLDRIGHTENADNKVVLLGQSFGGYVAQEFWYEYPERVRAMVIIGATSLTYPLSRTNRMALRLSPMIFAVYPNRLRVRQAAKGTAVREDVQRYAERAGGELSKREFGRVWRAVARGLRKDPERRIDCPLLLTHGGQDQVGVVAAEAPRWAEREPYCRYEVIPEAGHNANQDNAQHFNEVLLAFLRDHVPARGGPG